MVMSPAKVGTRFLLLSDTHSALPEPSTSHEVAYRLPLPEADVAIHTGDLTMTGKVEEHIRAVELLKSIRAPLKIVIPGNHDLTLDKEYYNARRKQWGTDMTFTSEQLDQIQQLYTGTEAKSHGIQYMVEGIQTFQLANGGTLTVYASAYTPEFCDWAFAYPRDKDRFSAKNNTTTMHTVNPIPTYCHNEAASMEHDPNIDVLMTHGPPQTILDQTPNGDKVGCEHLLHAVKLCRPLLHCFGHIHEGWGAINKTWPADASNPLRTRSNANNETAEKNLNDGVISDTAVGTHKWSQGEKSDEMDLMVDLPTALKDSAVNIDATAMERGHETLFVNASIMSLQYEPVQAPWVIDLLLNKR